MFQAMLAHHCSAAQYDAMSVKVFVPQKKFLVMCGRGLKTWVSAVYFSLAQFHRELAFGGGSKQYGFVLYTLVLRYRR